MQSLTDLVKHIVIDKPQIYGGDKGTGKLFEKVLEILEKDQISGATTLTSVERIRRKFLEKNPRYDHRDNDLKQRRA